MRTVQMLRRRRSPTHRSPWSRRLRRGIVAASCVAVLLLTWSIGGALTAPGTDSTAARLAEWGRDHGLGGVVTYLETQQYLRNQPTVGGLPPGGIPPAPGALPGSGGSGAGARPAPAPIPDLAGDAALPGEGHWQTAVTVHDRAAARVALVRPDAEHTSYLAGVLWLDPALVRGQLRPGFHDPGGSWQAATSLTTAEQQTVVAAFDSGFRLTNNASHGGYYSEGRTVTPLVPGAASLVLRSDGTADVGAWNQEVRLTPDVASVRQNLVMLVDNGTVNPTCATGGSGEWGSTLGNAAYIDRSGFGVTADGAEVYVGGAALSVCTLGRILQAAGVVRGMELDINPAWVNGAYFHAAPGLQPYRVYPAEKAAPQHFLSPSSRDWFAWFARY